MGSENEMVAVPRFWMRLLEATEVLVKRTETEAGFYREWSAAEHAATAARERLARLAPAQPDAQQGEAVARLFHETYERLAPSFGYETRADTKAFDPNSPNGKLMIAVCSHVAASLATPSSPALDAATIERFRALSTYLIDQHDEPWPQGTETDRLHYWRDKAIAAGNELERLALPNAEKRHG